jgi:hypothetical protein
MPLPRAALEVGPITPEEFDLAFSALIPPAWNANMSRQQGSIFIKYVFSEDFDFDFLRDINESSKVT